jgi:thiosulfate/3-mercaptopyruvate sulfurtransferase
VNITMGKLSQELEPRKNRGIIVLYSNGMTHPAQARDSLHRQGFGNVYLLTDGLQGFMERCLKPVSLRSEPLPPEAAARIRAWRAFFITAAAAQPPGAGPARPT